MRAVREVMGSRTAPPSALPKSCYGGGGAPAGLGGSHPSHPPGAGAQSPVSQRPHPDPVLRPRCSRTSSCPVGMQEEGEGAPPPAPSPAQGSGASTPFPARSARPPLGLGVISSQGNNLWLGSCPRCCGMLLCLAWGGSRQNPARDTPSPAPSPQPCSRPCTPGAARWDGEEGS